MSAIRNLPISRKFTYAFGIVCSLCVVFGVYTFLTLHSIAAKSADISEKHVPSLIHIGTISTRVNVERREDLELMLCQTPACTADHTAKRQKAIAEYQDALKAMEPLIIPQELDHYHAFLNAIKKYQDASDRGIDLLVAGKTGDALDLLSSDAMMVSLNDALSATDGGFQIHAKIGMEESQSVTGASYRAIWIGAGITLLIVFLCALTGVFLTREIAPRINRLKNAVQAMAEKDLTASIRVSGTDEIGRLGDAFNTSVSSIRTVLQSVAQGADTLSAATTEISARAVQSAGNAHTQSSKTNQIAAAAQEMTATIGEISHNAESAASRQPRIGRDRRSGRRRDAGRRCHHGENCRRHQLSL